MRNRRSLPVPEHIEAERCALGHVISSASERDADAMLEVLEIGHFSHLGHQELLQTLKGLRAGHRAVDALTVTATGKKLTWWNSIGGMQGIESILKASEAPFFSALEILNNERTLRQAKASAEAILEAIAAKQTPEAIAGQLRAVGEVIARPAKTARSVLTMTNPKDHLKYEPPAGCCLIGNYDIFRGYEGVFVVAGYPGTGKSLLASSIALAGATGGGSGKTWQGRPVHRKYKTMTIQGENGAMRLKNEFAAMQANFPRVKLEDYIRVSTPPEGGIPFHRPEFRRAVAAEVREFQPDIIIVDPWTSVAADDKSSDVIEKLAEIRSCLPGGDECPALGIVAHMRKPSRSADGIKSGRSLLHELSGSLALGSTARTVFALLPFTDDIADDRVVFSFCKHNNDPAPPADTVWHRRLGNFFELSKTEAAEFWQRSSAKESDRGITEDQMASVFRGRLLARPRAAEALMDLGYCRDTAYKALKLDGKFAGSLVDKGGLLAWEGGDSDD